MEDDSSGPTLRDIADAAGVSVASVSKVLNNRGGVGDESRRKILGLAEQLGYQGRTARSLLRAGVQDTVLIVPAAFYSSSNFYEDVIRGALEEAASSSLKVDVHLVSLDVASTTAEIEERLLARPAAVVLVGIDNPGIIDRVVQANVPAVLINGMDRTMRLSSVLPDNWSAGWLAARRLLEAGHRELMHVTLPNRLTMQRRLEGFRVALEEAGIAFDPDRHVLDLGKRGLLEIQAQSAAGQALAEGVFDKVTGLFCNSDAVALGVMQALQRHGHSVPEDFSVIGVDDVPIAMHSRPPLTTLRIDRSELGRVGIQLLLKRISYPDAGVSRVNIGVTLIERETVGPPRPA